MGFYVRYFDAEALLPSEQDIIPFIAGLNMLSPKEMDVLGTYMGKLRNGTNRIFLDKSKKKYILAIATDKTDIASFQKNTKKEALPAQKPAKKKGTSAAELQNEGWFIYSLEYQLMCEGAAIPYTFKAKVKDASLLSAYTQMAAYLRETHGDDCLILEFGEAQLTVEPAQNN